VKFLVNSKVTDAPLEKKHLFLSSKGLTENEIELAFAMANQRHVAQSDDVERHNSLTVAPGVSI
jgi:hypothetical protein